MKECVQFIYRCVYIYYTCNSVENYDHQTFFQETAIAASALLHLTWKRGHYMLQQEFRDGFIAVPKSLY